MRGDHVVDVDAADVAGEGLPIRVAERHRAAVVHRQQRVAVVDPGLIQRMEARDGDRGGSPVAVQDRGPGSGAGWRQGGQPWISASSVDGNATSFHAAPG